MTICPFRCYFKAGYLSSLNRELKLTLETLLKVLVMFAIKEKLASSMLKPELVPQNQDQHVPHHILS